VDEGVGTPPEVLDRVVDAEIVGRTLEAAFEGEALQPMAASERWVTA